MTLQRSGPDQAEIADQTSKEAALMWLKDAPLFIDTANLARVYDAVVRPVYKEDAPVTIKLTDAIKKELQGKLDGKATAGVAPWIDYILKMGVEVSASGQTTSGSTNTEETTITLYPISTPQRQLEQLAIWYFFNHPDHLLVGGAEQSEHWQRDGLAERSPRSLVFVDLPKGTKLIPMAAELQNGCVETFFDKLHAKNGENPPKEFLHDKEQDYWNWFDRNFDAQRSIELIEKASTDNKSRIEWIDFRAPISDKCSPIHLHMVGGGEYSTGVFAYHLVRRTLGHGSRIVGSLKDGPAINVLAVYEK